jgi:hypothetical protein
MAYRNEFIKASRDYLNTWLIPEINATPTGPDREQLTDAQIYLLEIISAQNVVSPETPPGT